MACSSDDTVVTVDAGGPDGNGGGDGSVDGATDGGTDSGFDGGYKVDTFPDLLATQLCASLAKCCYGSANPPDGGIDGGSFDVTSCKDFYRDYGFEGSNIGHDFVDAGAITVDQTAADDCVKKIQNMACSLAGTDFTAIRQSCFNAYGGTLGAGSPCHDSVECASGNYCQPDAAAPAVDGGVIGACATLVALGQSCANDANDPGLAEEACSWRVSGQPNNHCSFFDPGDPTNLLDAGDWKCTAASAVGGGCAASNWCADSICNDALQCVTPDDYFADTCGRFVK